MKFGGTSVADAQRLKRAARRIVEKREQGHDVVAVLSARGKTTDELIAMAEEVSPVPDPREMDMLLSTGERISCALCAMAINDLGHSAISLTGSQAGIVTDTSHTKARILDVRADRIRAALAEGKIVLVAGFQGVSRSARSTPTSPASSVPIRGSCPERANSPSSLSRRCSRCRLRGPVSCSCAQLSTPARMASAFTVVQALTRGRVPLSWQRRKPWNSHLSQPSLTPPGKPA